MKKYYVLFFLFLSILVSSQKINLKKYDYTFSPELIYQKDFFGGINLAIGNIVINKTMIGISGMRIGIESNFKTHSDFIIAPKIGYEIAATFITLRLTGINYFQNGETQLRILPEIGITAGGYINLTYGYNIRISSSHINDISNHRLCLSFNLNKKLKKEIFP